MRGRASNQALREPSEALQGDGLLYVQLASLFRRKIALGEWSKGDQLPTVAELAAQCGVARGTIRQAMDLLHRDKLIDRKRALGTFVTGDQREPLWCDLHTDYFGLLQSREGAEIELLSEERAVPIPVNVDMGEVAGSYRHLQRRHWRKAQPYLLADLFISESLAERIPRSDFTAKTALKLVADVPDVELAEVEQVMTIGAADLTVAEMLRVPLNSPIAEINRYALDRDKQILLFARGSYRGDIVRLNIKTK